MKIIHVWDQAAVACTLSKYQKKIGHDSIVVKRNGYDPHRIMDFYKEKTLNVKFNKIFNWLVVQKAKNFDIIHIHDHFRLSEILRKKYPKKKIILHYHGSVLRLTPRKILEKYENKVDCILVSTPDLLDFVDATYLPNPIDMEHFSPRKVSENGKTISFMSKFESQDLLEKLLEKNKISLKVNFHDRTKNPVNYYNMPEYLSQFEYLIDLKLVYNHNPAPAYSCLGLQALSLGLKVVNYNFKIENKFPVQHKPETVINQLMKIYGSI